MVALVKEAGQPGQFSATELLIRLSPRLNSRACFAMIFGYLHEFKYVCALIEQLCKAGQQFVSPNSIANGYELLKVVCFYDERFKERNMQIKELLSSIKVIGPKYTDKEILMEVPSRKQLRASIIERAKADWFVEEEEDDD